MISRRTFFFIFPLGVVGNSDMSSTRSGILKWAPLSLKKALTSSWVTDPPGLEIIPAQVSPPGVHRGWRLRSPGPPWDRYRGYFDLRGRDVFAPPDDHAFDPADDPQVSVFIHGGQVVAVDPTPVIDGLGGAIRVFKISDADVLPTGAGFSLLPPQRHDSPQRSQSTPAKDHARVKYPLKLSTDPTILHFDFWTLKSLPLRSPSARR